MYKFGDILSYETKKGNYIPFVVLSDVEGVLYGYVLVNSSRVKNNYNERYIEIPKVSINKKEYTYIDTKNNLSIESLQVIDENKYLNYDASNKLRSRLDLLYEAAELREGVMENIELCEKLISCRTKLEPLSSDYHMPTFDDLFPNGSGRTEEQFKEDTKYLPKKYLLKYYEMKDKQQ